MTEKVTKAIGAGWTARPPETDVNELQERSIEVASGTGIYEIVKRGAEDPEPPPCGCGLQRVSSEGSKPRYS